MHFSLSLTFFGIYLIVLLFILRFFRKLSPTLTVCGCALLIYLSAFIFISTQHWQIHFFSFSALYWFLSLSLIMIFGAVYKSISLRVMLHLFTQPEKTDSYKAILENYINNQSYHKRIEILIEKRWLEKSGPFSFRLTQKGSLFAKKIKRIQNIFSITESG